MLLSDRSNDAFSLLLPLDERQHCFVFSCFYFFIYIFVPLHTDQSVATISGAIYIQWANPIRPHCINTHLAAAVMKGFVSNWTVFLGDAPCHWLNAIYVFSVMKWMMEVDLLVKCPDVAKLFPFWKVESKFRVFLTNWRKAQEINGAI